MGKSVLVTGCSENTIGNGLALEFAKRGWTVYAVARNITKMANLEGIPNIKPLPLDIMDAKGVLAARDQISVEQGGRLDCLYHNAGARSTTMAIDYDADEKKAGEEQPYVRSSDVRMFETNVIAVMALTRAFSKLLIAAKGTIAITGSGASRVPVPTNSTYNATKAAVEMYAKTLRLELQPFGCHVVYVMTGAVATTMYSEKMTLADDSLYKPISDRIVAGWDRGPGYVPQTPEEYAQYVVERVARTNPPKEVWCGTGIAPLWWVQKLGLTWLLPIVFSRRHGLDTSL
ncbi:NAD(P)-binding protein [Fusarium pseudocircinatum]|uniref:NAD(P)-binding protein n=1 Tax=Fusarium pseudocircinatum TaxID=56676 RepID=A0A8H5UZ62_9HYPO|nr:NAD(P)-binding protein [Fusarium pseudocircinatum]